MLSTFRKFFAIIIFTIFLSAAAGAQPRKGEFIDASIGLGISFPDDGSTDISGSGFFAQGEYVFGVTTWFGVRPYAGVILTSADKSPNDQYSEYKVTSNALLLGGKARICAPIPWFAPYVEVGIGASVGSFETHTPYSNIKQNGLLVHIPWTIGLALGPKHNIEVEFTYYQHPTVNQVCGAAALGFSFPIH